MKLFLTLSLLLTPLIYAQGILGNCDSLVVDERLPNIIDKTMKLSATKVYGIDRKVSVTNGASLEIEAGTTVVGCSLFSYLVIEKDAKIIAQGSATEPITFTSQIDLMGYSTPQSVGEWGGIVIAGNAYAHYTDNKFEADESVAFGSQTHNSDNESSGVLEYVIIKHTGYKVKKDKELNALSLAAVGSGTTLRNLAIIGGSDDGVELWGGCVNINGLYIYNARDDSLDADLGYRGTIKNVLIKQCGIDSKNNHDSAAIEVGNDENLITTNEKNATLPTIENLSAYIKGGGIYNKYDAGWRLKNIKIISQKSRELEMLVFRGADSYTTGAKFLDGELCFHNSKKSIELENIFSNHNVKGEQKHRTAYEYFIQKKKAQGSGRFMISDDCKGVDETDIWTGDI